MDPFPVTDGVHTVIAAPSGYQVDFANPHRDTNSITRIYSCFATGLILSLLFLMQNIYVKLCVNKELDAPTG